MTSHVTLYLSLIALEALLTWAAYRWAHAAGWTIGDLVGARSMKPAAVIRDVAIAAALWGTFTLAMHGWTLLRGSTPSPAVDRLLPHGPVDATLWILLSLSAGFAEELMFRGYLQRRLETRGPILAILGQAVIFGVMHFYQGFWPVVRITIYGVMFGVVARWRRSLRPGMIAHAWTDIAAGLLQI